MCIPGTNMKTVKITLTTPGWMTWWKAVTMHTPQNTFKYELVYNQDSHSSDTAIQDYSEMLTSFVVLSKAKMFGIHTNMYWIRNSYDLKPTNDWEIQWLKD